jgi:hypothetical protein
VHKLISKGLIRAQVLLTLGMAAVAHGQQTLNWTAFNDHYAGADTAPYTTEWNVFNTEYGAPGNSGPLMDVATGETLPVTLTINFSNGVGGGTTSGAPNPNTPAYEVFNGYIDWRSGPAPTAPQIYGGGQVDYVFTGLTPNKRYSFIGTGVRGGSGSSYRNRWTLIELMGADSFRPAHTTGTGAYTNGLTAAQLAINTGMNSTTGDYADWEDIAPGDDGTITIHCTQYTGPIPTGTAGGQYCYALMAIRFQEFNAFPSPAVITIQPKNQTVLELSAATFHAAATGNPRPAYQWYKNADPILRATNDTYTLLSAPLADNSATFSLVASNWVSNVACLATSSVAVLTVLPDTTPPVLQSVLPLTNSTINRLKTIEVFFSKAVSGVDASDLLMNGIPATNVDGITPSQYYFEFAEPPPGEVHVAWSADPGITDCTAASNHFAGGTWNYRIDTNVVYSVRINEFMAANKHIIRDEDGDYSDWIELYNSGAVTVPLDNCFLTDDDRNLSKWQFPAVSIPPNSYMLVWASAKNRTNSTAPLHTNFQLNKDGGYLALVLSDGARIVSAFAPSYPAQSTDVAYGSDRGNPALIGYFTSPTPGAPNATAGANFGPEVRFSRDSGTFITPFSLVLSTTSTNAVIRYTLGTNMPTASSPLYTGPLLITNTVQVRAQTFVTGLLPGDIQSKDYILLDSSPNTIPGSSDNVVHFNSSLPIVVFHNYGKGSVPMSDPGQFAMIQVFEPKNGRSSLTNIPDLAIKGTIHRRGQATRGNPKANLRVETQNEYGDGKAVSLVGMPADNDWVFYGINSYDKVLMHNPLAHQLYRQLGRYSSRTRFVEVYLKADSGTPGPLTAEDYNGLYVIEEKIKISKDRVNIDELQAENTTAPSVTGGYLVSIDKDGPTTGFSAADSYLWYLNPDGFALNTPQRAPQTQYIRDYLNAFYAALTGPNWTDPAAGYAAYIDVPAFIDYNLHQVLMFNADMLRISSYYCKPRNGKLTPAALWDFDRAFGMYAQDGDQRGFNPWRWHSGAGDRGTDPFNADGDGAFNNPWYSRMFLDIDFWQQYIDRFQELRRSVYSDANVTALIDRLGNEVAEATPREYARWGGSWGSDTTPNEGTVSGDGWTYTFPTPGTWPAEVEFVKVWFTNRLTFIDTNFLATPTLSLSGGAVTSGSSLTLSPANEPGSSVVYTLNGTDPRLPGGTISPSAVSHLGPVTITITNNLHVFARSWNPAHQNLTGPHNPPLSSPWSGVTAESFYTVVPALRITEIMYHPGQPPAGSTNAPSDFEYLELTNTGSNSVNLVGFRLAHGIEFTFTPTSRITSLAPGGRVLIVKNSIAFAARYPDAATEVAGEYSGQLNNACNHLTLAGPFGEPIQDFTYENQWYPVTDGLGFALVATDENAPFDSWGNPKQWRPSAFDGGSPGAADPAPTLIQPALVNEIQARPVPPNDDAIEVWNPNASPVDISYWYLTDSRQTPKKFLIPPGTILPAFGFAVFHRTNSFGTPSATNILGQTNEAFGFNAGGDSVYLFSGDNQGRLTGYYDGFDYGAAALDVTFGRYVNSIGHTMYVAQSANTLGMTNAYPGVGPVVISELMYHPPALIVDGMAMENARDEFIELHNLSSTPVPLYDTNAPANTWHLREGIQFDFPSGAVMAPNACLLVVSFSPDADPVALAGFQARYGLSNHVSIYGPFTGQLNNAGDRVEVRRPDVPNPNTQIAPMILVDRVEYGVDDPWPAAPDGTGASLQRIDLAAFGNDPVNWISADPTPGRVQATPVVVGVAIEVQGSSVVISWDNSAVVWQLEETTGLEPSSAWQTSTAAPTLSGDRWQTILPLSATASKYFRLRSR